MCVLSLGKIWSVIYQEKRFTELVNARKESDAKLFPLELFHTYFDEISAIVQRNGANFIKLNELSESDFDWKTNLKIEWRKVVVGLTIAIGNTVKLVCIIQIIRDHVGFKK